jgi:hypothetical protein
MKFTLFLFLELKMTWTETVLFYYFIYSGIISAADHSGHAV